MRRRSWWTKHRQQRTPRVARVPVSAPGWRMCSVGLIGSKICQDDTNHPARAGESTSGYLLGYGSKMVKNYWLSFNIHMLLLIEMTNLGFYQHPCVSARLYTVLWIIPRLSLSMTVFYVLLFDKSHPAWLAWVESNIETFEQARRECELDGSWFSKQCCCHMLHFLQRHPVPLNVRKGRQHWQVCSSRGALPKRPRLWSSMVRCWSVLCFPNFSWPFST